MVDEELFEAEKNLISGCIRDKDIYYKAASIVHVDDFENVNHQIIFQDICELREQKGTCDYSTLIEYMSSKKDLAKINDGSKYIADLVTTYMPLLDEVDYLVEIIKNKATARKFFSVLNQIEYDYKSKPIEDISSFIGQAENKILEVTRERRVSEFRNTSEVIEALNLRFQSELQFRMDNNIKDTYLTGYPTGYEDLDKLFGGFHPSNLMVLAARPGVGKTALALNFAQRMAKAGRTIGIFTLEMSADEVLLRILSMESRLPTDVISRISVSNDSYYSSSLADRQSLEDAISTLKQEKLFIDDTSSIKVEDIVSKTRKLKSRYPDLSLVIIDYLGLIGSSTKSNNISRAEDVGKMTRALKIMAKDLNVPVLVLCQLSREIEKRNDHRPNLSDLRDSGSIEQDADMVFFIYRPDYYKDSNKDGSKNLATNTPNSVMEKPASSVTTSSDVSDVTLILEKNRSGRQGDVKLNFYKKYFRFEAVIDEDRFPGEPS